MFKRRNVVKCLLAVMPVLGLTACGPTPQQAMVRGSALYDQGKYQEAFKLLDKAFRGGIDDPEMLVRLAFCRASVAGKVGEAIELLRDSAVKHPKFARTYYELGYLAYTYGPKENDANIKQALEFTRQAADLDTGDWRIRDNLGMYYGLLGELDSSYYWLKKAKEVRGDHQELNERLEQLEKYMAERDRQDSVAAAADSIKKAQ